ncbi:hypothetical protein POTOM_052200 [Populus tomentosa]|uniref:Uncharacterized protein n=1 Tax=Populus tomentosa TaxID=118781 RepID=A0A8X7Y3P4_POPTO|nr:hypothetical protein POTOM_052200 [Populus tomentosa]
MEAKVEKVVAQINQILDNIINEHKEMGNSDTTEEDLVDMLVRLQEDGTFNIKGVEIFNIKGVLWTREMFVFGVHRMGYERNHANFPFFLS